MTTKTVVLALGNPLRGDDGAAAAVLAALRARPLPTGVTLIDGGTPGLETVLLLRGYERALIIDAAEMGLAPGEWRCFTPDEATLATPDDFVGTLHSAGLAEALALGQVLDMLPPRIEVIGIQPTRVDWEEGLSAAVTAVVPAITAHVVASLASSPET